MPDPPNSPLLYQAWLAVPTNRHLGPEEGRCVAMEEGTGLRPFKGPGASSRCIGCLHVSSVVSQDRPTQIPPWRQVIPNSSKEYKEENIPETLC